MCGVLFIDDKHRLGYLPGWMPPAFSSCAKCCFMNSNFITMRQFSPVCVRGFFACVNLCGSHPRNHVGDILCPQALRAICISGSIMAIQLHLAFLTSSIHKGHVTTWYVYHHSYPKALCIHMIERILFRPDRPIAVHLFPSAPCFYIQWVFMCLLVSLCACMYAHPNACAYTHRNAACIKTNARRLAECRGLRLSFFMCMCLCVYLNAYMHVYAQTYTSHIEYMMHEYHDSHFAWKRLVTVMQFAQKWSCVHTSVYFIRAG